MVDEELALCPFCGGEAEIEHNHNKYDPVQDYTFVVCTQCAARTAWFRRVDVESRFKYQQENLDVLARVAWNNGIIYFPRCEIPWCAMFRYMEKM